MQVRNAGDGALELFRGASSFFLITLALGVVGLGSIGVAVVQGLARLARR